jgi:hypothetical protein
MSNRSESNRRLAAGLFLVIGIVTLCWLTPPRSPRPRQRAQRLQALNVVYSVSFTLPRTNALPGALIRPP